MIEATRVYEDEEALSLDALSNQGLVEVVWPDANDVRQVDPDRYQIAFMHASEKLLEAIDKGDLDVFFQELSLRYRNIYGGKPWDEYLSCSDEACDGKRGIGDVYSSDSAAYSDLALLEAQHNIDPQDYCCPKCSAPMEFFYAPEALVDRLKSGFAKEVYAALLFKGDADMKGFALGWGTTIEGGWADKEVQGEGDAAVEKLSYERYLQEVGLYIGEVGGKETGPDSKAFNSAEWALEAEARQSGYALPLARVLLEETLNCMTDAEQDDVPVLGHALEKSRAMTLFKRFGYMAGETIEASGEARVYASLRNLVGGLEGFSQRSAIKESRPKIEPVPETTPIPRDTLVIEMRCDEAVGSGREGELKVLRYLSELAGLLALPKVRPPVAHLSSKYGFSGWLPLEDGSAIHLYAWDYEDGTHSPFVSIDISTIGVLANNEAVIAHAKDFFGANSLVHKTMQHQEDERWHELAPEIFRQRLTITGRSQEAITPDILSAYLSKLAVGLDMERLGEPIVVGNSAWVHWETSGVVVHWSENELGIDIYTCKSFDPRKALELTKGLLSLDQIAYKQF